MGQGKEVIKLVVMRIRGKGKKLIRGKGKQILEYEVGNLIDDYYNYQWDSDFEKAREGETTGEMEDSEEDSNYKMGSDSGNSEMDNAFFEDTIDREVEWADFEKVVVEGCEEDNNDSSDVVGSEDQEFDSDMGSDDEIVDGVSTNAIRAIRAEKLNPEEFVRKCYTIETYNRIYTSAIQPMENPMEEVNIEAVGGNEPMEEGNQAMEEMTQAEDIPSLTQESQHTENMEQVRMVVRGEEAHVIDNLEQVEMGTIEKMTSFHLNQFISSTSLSKYDAIIIKPTSEASPPISNG
ncbi:hypothetical protein OROHE_002710 [Orobanche hederae]